MALVESNVINAEYLLENLAAGFEVHCSTIRTKKKREGHLLGARLAQTVNIIINILVVNQRVL